MAFHGKHAVRWAPGEPAGAFRPAESLGRAVVLRDDPGGKPDEQAPAHERGKGASVSESESDRDDFDFRRFQQVLK